VRASTGLRCTDIPSIVIRGMRSIALCCSDQWYVSSIDVTFR
jgi:hypothetical protein